MKSEGYIRYLKKAKRNKRIITLIQVLIFLSFITIWQILADNKIINTFIFSSPKRILETLILLYKSNNIFTHIGITIYEILISFSLSTILGILIASLLWWNKTLFKILDPYLTILNSLPKVSLGPLLIIILGATTKSIIIMALLICLIITILNIYQGFNETDTIKINMFKSFGATKYQIFTKLILPNNIPNIYNVIKVNISLCLIGVIMGEFLVSKAGIGYLITYGSQVFNLNLVMTGIFILSIIATLMYVLINFIANKNTR